VLVVHGTDDRILPFDATAARLPALIADCTLVPVEGVRTTSAGRTPRK
jgi:non-heme chloroperoxidase